MRLGSMLECQESSGTPTTAGDVTVTPLARSLVLRWPRGGVVWSGPSAVVVQREGRTERIPIVNVNRRILWSIRAGTVALIASWILHARRGDRSNG